MDFMRRSDSPIHRTEKLAKEKEELLGNVKKEVTFAGFDCLSLFCFFNYVLPYLLRFRHPVCY